MDQSIRNSKSASLKEIKNPKTSFAYLKQAQFVSECLNSREMISQLALLGLAFTKEGDIDKALSYYYQVNNLCLEENLHNLRAEALNLIGNCYMLLGNVKNTFKYYNQAYELSVSINEDKGIAWNSYCLAKLYKKLNSDECIKYSNVCLNKLEQFTKYDLNEAESYLHYLLAFSYNLKNSKDKTIKHLEKSLELYKRKRS